MYELEDGFVKASSEEQDEFHALARQDDNNEGFRQWLIKMNKKVEAAGAIGWQVGSPSGQVLRTLWKGGYNVHP
jgi:hypothetical protein